MEDLASPKLATAEPFGLNAMLAAKGLDSRLVVRLEDILPRQIDPSSVVPHVHHLLLGEPVTDCPRDSFIDPGAVGDGGHAATARGGQFTVEEDLERPTV